MESLNDIISRRRFVALGAGSAAVLASPLSASAVPSRGFGGGIGSDSGFVNAAPTAVAGTAMNSKGIMDFIAIGPNSSTLQTNDAGTGVFNNGNGSLVCTLDMAPGARLKQVDAYGLRVTAGAQTWQLKKVNATTGTTTIIGTRNPTGTGLVQATFTGLDEVIGGLDRYFVELTGPTDETSSLAVGVAYQFVGLSTGLVLFGGDTGGGAGGGGGNGAPPTIPMRVYDSRQTGGGGKISNNQMRTVSVKDQIPSAGGRLNVVPEGARAIAYNLTIDHTEGTFGYLSVAPGLVNGDQNQTFVQSVINWDHANATIANGLIVAISANRDIIVFCGGDAARGLPKTDFVIDVTGYFI